MRPLVSKVSRAHRVKTLPEALGLASVYLSTGPDARLSASSQPPAQRAERRCEPQSALSVPRARGVARQWLRVHSLRPFGSSLCLVLLVLIYLRLDL